MMKLIILIFLSFLHNLDCQNVYVPSQLELYLRLLRSQNLGGLGGLENAASRIEVAEKQQLLSGLPPLPMTHDDVIHVLTTEVPTTTQKSTARPTTPLPIPNPFVLNNIPEIPPIPEERLGGTYDEDGNFVAFKKNTAERKRNIALGARNYQLSDTTSLKQKYSYEPQFHQSIHPTKERFIRQHSTPPPRPTFPPLVFRAKPQPKNRDPFLNNLLIEIEEYDDFLDQVNQYKSQYPGARVPNPYAFLPEGKLPALNQYNLNH